MIQFEIYNKEEKIEILEQNGYDVKTWRTKSGDEFKIAIRPKQEPASDEEAINLKIKEVFNGLLKARLRMTLDLTNEY